MPKDLDGKTIIVTGAGKGIGRATCLMLSELCANVVALSRTASDLSSLQAETGCQTYALDIGNSAELRTVVQGVVAADGLVNCAGINILEPFLEVTEESFDEIYAINTKAAMIAAQEFSKTLIAAKRKGAIVNVSSMSSFVGFADHTSYCASKGAMDAMSRVMANELGEHGIRVNCINPIITMTELAAEAWSDPVKSGPILSRVPVGHFADVDDIANLIVFLLSENSRMLNATAIPVDGGFLAR
ncbi:SDR family oxidoreductase [Pararhizobium sp. IMCC21322]|uniref:SDR family oxidoreductase n=1 Tax=Pararhizobium sp. IMCC21322 TaxID=3067903 RepID=UPI0027428477|nr:SDR family oxidoreductase [Pararhizobium sp. IMCC21322]